MAHGGRRPNAGRKRGGKWGEPTKAIRIPISKLDAVYKLLLSPSDKSKALIPEQPALSAPYIHLIDDSYCRPLYSGNPPTSFTSIPEPTEKFNLNAYLLPHPKQRIFVRTPDNAMIDAGINEGDMLIVDTHRPVVNGCLVAIIVNDELLIREVLHTEEGLILASANPLYPPLQLSGDIHFTLLGVVTAAIHEFSAGYF